jgi:predicted membrane chloride channel (bestrophin family)
MTQKTVDPSSSQVRRSDTVHISLNMDEEEEETEIMNMPLHRRRTAATSATTSTSSTSNMNASTTPRGSNSNSQNKELSWEELQRIERRRRAILRRSELPYFKILLSVEGTCLRDISRDWLLWFTMVVFCLVRLEEWYFGGGTAGASLPSVARQLGRLNIDILGGFLSFFLVLFVNQSNARFQQMYGESRAMMKRIHDVASIVHHVVVMPSEDAQHHGKRLVRYMNAAHAAAYVGLNDTYTSRNFFTRLNAQYAWLTTGTEMERIQAFDMDRCLGPAACHELIEWCLHDVETAYKNTVIKEKDYNALRDKILQFRGSVDTIYDYCDQPIHFFYIHFLCLLSALYLPLFAVTQAVKAGSTSSSENNGTADTSGHWISDLVSGLIVFLQAIFVIGLRMLGRKMIDPYGSDLEDLSVLHYIETAWQRSQAVFLAQYPGQVSAATEEELATRAASSSTNMDQRGGWIAPSAGHGNIV